jgi:dTDP-4-dehydrorhamnose reductase
VKILLTGADGALGQSMQSLLKQKGIQHMATDIKQLDITDFKMASEIITQYRPDVILHLAAISNVDECEEQKELALQVNALSAMGLALIAKRIGAKILYVSTNYVFDGESELPYSEYSRVHPVNEYGRTKYLGEQYVRDLCDRFVIVRTSWLFGPKSKTFLSRFMMKTDKPSSINVICDQFASFTYIPDLADAILKLISSEHYGIFHIVNRGIGSWLDYALRAKDLMKFKTELLPTETHELNLPAARPRYAPLDSYNYEFLFNKTMRTWENALAEFVKSIKKPDNVRSQ